MHDLLYAHQDALRPPDLVGYARRSASTSSASTGELKRHEHTARIARDVESADLSEVTGTPSFFVNGARHRGAYDLASLVAAVRAARQRAVLVPE